MERLPIQLKGGRNLLDVDLPEVFEIQVKTQQRVSKVSFLSPTGHRTEKVSLRRGRPLFLTKGEWKLETASGSQVISVPEDEQVLIDSK